MQIINTKFEKWVKIRIGEPITALDINQNQLIFGSISGYIGYYNINSQELKYIQHIFEEIIRGIHIRPDQKAYVTVGDYYGIILDITSKDWNEVRYERRSHNQTLCSSSLALLRHERVLLMTVAPTQNKDLGAFDISIKKNSLFVLSLDTKEMTHFQVEMPQLCVPFDFDGSRLLLLEYLPGAKKRMHMYDFQQRKLEVVYQVPHKVEFISHGRLIKNLLIFVEDHRKVKIYDLSTKKESMLFKADSQIVAFDAKDPSEGPVLQPLSIEEESKEQSEIISQQTDLSKIQISCVDYNCNLIIWNENKITQNLNLLRLNGVPEELRKHKYIFDMGYPYYLKVNDRKVAISNDLGILVVSY